MWAEASFFVGPCLLIIISLTSDSKQELYTLTSMRNFPVHDSKMLTSIIFFVILSGLRHVMRCFMGISNHVLKVKYLFAWQKFRKSSPLLFDASVLEGDVFLLSNEQKHLRILEVAVNLYSCSFLFFKTQILHNPV